MLLPKNVLIAEKKQVCFFRQISHSLSIKSMLNRYSTLIA